MKRFYLSIIFMTGVFLLYLCPCALASDFAPIPDGHPLEIKNDTFAETSYEPDYNLRLQDYRNLTVESRGTGPFTEAVRMSMGLMPNEECMRAALDKMDARLDCADFGMQGILRVLYMFGNSGMLSQGFLDRVKETQLNFKYWPDELADADLTGPDSMCSWSENHHILLCTGAYLAGQYFPDDIFRATGHTGQEKMDIFRPRIIRWLDFRYQTGFSEWLSNCYYNEDFPALLNLIDFCQDEEIVKKATMVVDLMIADMALNQFKGTFGSTHGRSYMGNKHSGQGDSTGAANKLIFGTNTFGVGNFSAASFVTSEKYKVPNVFYEIANDSKQIELVNQQRMGIRMEDAEDVWGLDFKRLEDGMVFLSFEAYTHPRTINLFMEMMDAYNWWENSFFGPFQRHKDLIDTARTLNIMPLVAVFFEKDITRNLRSEVNIYTYKTPNYMLSSAQDHRKGYGGDQQSIWQATLGKDAVCFTTHPGTDSTEDDTPNYWSGSGNLPRVAQVGNVAIILYDISTKEGLYLTHTEEYTHAYLPRDKFDEIVEQDGWIFAKKGDGYLALWSQQPYVWQNQGEYAEKEIIADGKQNVWLCELGRKADDVGFGGFMERIGKANVKPGYLNVTYDSPSQGTLQFCWLGDLKQNGKPVKLNDYPRYGNPYADASFPGDKITFEYNGEHLDLDYTTLDRKASSFLGEAQDNGTPGTPDDGTNPSNNPAETGNNGDSSNGDGDSNDGFCFIGSLY